MNCVSNKDLKGDTTVFDYDQRSSIQDNLNSLKIGGPPLVGLDAEVDEDGEEQNKEDGHHSHPPLESTLFWEFAIPGVPDGPNGTTTKSFFLQCDLVGPELLFIINKSSTLETFPAVDFVAAIACLSDLDDIFYPPLESLAFAEMLRSARQRCYLIVILVIEVEMGTPFLTFLTIYLRQIKDTSTFNDL